jgi:RNA polymerase sigma-70 factor (ECF subfamily)
MNQSERNAKILAEVQNLPEIYREVVTLFYFEQQTYEQMSAVLGIGGPAINARLMKARVLLRERLKSVTA